MLRPPETTSPGVALVLIETWAFRPPDVSVFETRCDAPAASRWPFRAACGFDGRKIRGSVDGRGSVVAVRCTPPAPVAVTCTVATPAAFVLTVEGTALEPVAERERSRFGSGTPAAESTRMVAVAVFPAPIATGSATSTRYGP